MAMYIPEVDRRPHVFLSHSSDDKTFITKLADDLNVCEVDVWLDKYEMGPADSLYVEISEGLQQSRYIALLLSNSFLKKKWATAELKAAFAREMQEDGKVIVPLLLEKVEIPTMLKDKIYLSFIDEYYPSLFSLAGFVHGLTPQNISWTKDRLPLESLEQVVDALAYAGKDPYMIVPKDIFDEIASSGYATVKDNRLEFPSDIILQQPGVISQRAKDYLSRIKIGIIRDSRRELR